MSQKEGKLYKIRHSLAHILAMAVLEIRPEAKLGIGPVIQDGFFYDFDLKNPLSDNNLPELEKRMKNIIKKKLNFKKETISAKEAKELFKDQPYKLELIKKGFLEEAGGEIKRTKQKRVTIFRTGNFIDLCRGPHIKNMEEINPDAFKLERVAGAYWLGNEKNHQMQRVYGIAFENKKALEEYRRRKEEAQKRDHRLLGRQLDLFYFSNLVGAGLPLWTPKGTILRHLLDDFVWQLRKEKNYQKVEIPHLTKKDLYIKSGHWDKFSEELFKTESREGHLLVVKPMNCPHHTQIFNRRRRSYKELPIRYSDTTMVYRDEQSGELSGLSRVRSITQDDAHVFCRQSQIKEEITKIWDMVDQFYKTFGFHLNVQLSLKDPKQSKNYLGTPAIWKKSESELKRIAKERKVKVTEAAGEAAFYGPKVDFITQDSLGREWEVATIQLDMNLPERFDLTAINEKGKRERVFMIHAAIMGSLERFISILIEHYAGDFPFWLSPVQIAVLPITKNHTKYAETVLSELKQKNLRAELFLPEETLGKRILETENQKIPAAFILGDKEEKNKKVTLRKRGEKKQISNSLDKVLKLLQ